MEYKICSKCNGNKLFSEFSKMPKGKFGLAAACKACCNEEDKTRKFSRKHGTHISKYDVGLRSDKFLLDSKNKWSDKYDYSKTVYVKSKQDVIIHCTTHDIEFTCTPYEHINNAGGGCSLCHVDFISNLQLKSQQSFIDDCSKAHGKTYKYDRAIYKGAKEKVEIYCTKHEGYFWQDAGQHASGAGCMACSLVEGHQKLTLTHNEFLERAISAHGDTYKFDNVVYKGNQTPVSVTCKVHGDFPIAPSNLFIGRGCPNCASYGYNTSKEGSLYLLICDGITKIGITNRDVLTRVKEINKDSRKNFELLFSQQFNNGVTPFAIEYAMKVYLRATYEPVSEKYNGSTECFIDVDRECVLKMIKQQIINLECLC